MSSFTDWLAGTFFTSDDDIQTHKDVAAAQQAILDRQLDEGKVNALDYSATTAAIKDAGNYLGYFKADNSGALSLLSTVPWWVWAAAAGGAFLYFDGPKLVAKHVLKKI